MRKFSPDDLVAKYQKELEAKAAKRAENEELRDGLQDEAEQGVRLAEGGITPSTVVKPPEYEKRLPVVYVAVCLDRAEREGEEKNEVFWGNRLPNSLDHIEWGRVSARTNMTDAVVVFDRTILSPLKRKTIGNIIGIRAKCKTHAMRLLNQDPYVVAGLYGTRRLYRWPEAGAPELQLDVRAFPYFVLGMDHPDKAGLRKETRPAHLKYLKSVMSVTGAGPIFEAEEEDEDPSASTPVGSLVFFNAPDDAAAKNFTQEDPYSQVQLFKDVYIARFNELDVNGRHLLLPEEDDPMRDVMEKRGLAQQVDYASRREFNPFDKLTWLQKEYIVKNEEDYVKRRGTLYEERNVRIARGRINEGVVFKSGTYVYLGNRTHDEWYDFWPAKNSHIEEGYGEERSTMENAVPVYNVYEDDL